MVELKNELEVYADRNGDVMGAYSKEGLAWLGNNTNKSNENVEYIVAISSADISEIKMRRMDVYLISKGILKHLHTVKSLTDEAISSSEIKAMIQNIIISA